MIIVGEQEIRNILFMTGPFVFVTYAVVEPGVRATGYNDFNPDAWFFKHHFPGFPIVPGVFLQESLMQISTLALYSNNSDLGQILARKFLRLDFLASVEPGERLHLEAVITKNLRGVFQAKGRGYTRHGQKEKIVIEAEFQMVAPAILQKYRPGNNNVTR